jgi:hypothetical protein
MDNKNCCGGEGANNQNSNTATCGGCGLCHKIGWCGVGKGHMIIKIVILIIVLCFIGRMFMGDRGWRNDNQIVNTITVSGKGEVVVKPDIATVSFGVTAENLDVAKAQTESATKINKIIDLLKSKGVAEKDIKTTNYNIYPRYDYNQTNQTFPYGGKQVLAAYVVSQTVEVKILEIAKAGEILSGVGEFGVTDVSGLTFTVDDEEKVKDQARDLAIEDAKAQAKVLAKGLDVKLVKITSFSENANYPMYYGVSSAKMMDSAVSSVAPQVPAGENKITSNVSITYEIK